MLDLNNPLGFIASIIAGDRAKKWYKLTAGILVSSFVSFWGSFGLSGSAVLAYTKSPAIALITAFFIGCTVMAASVIKTVHQQKMWEELGIEIPKQLDTILAQTDVTK